MMAPTARLTVVSYNIHRGAGLDRRRDLDRIADVIEEISADIVGLQEVIRAAGGSVGRVPGSRLAMRHGGDAGRGRGAPTATPSSPAIPALGSRRCDLSRGVREPRGCLRVDMDVPGTPLHVFNVHFGLALRERRGTARAARREHSSTPALAGLARADGGLQRVASRAGDARPPPRVRVADAAPAHAPGDVPALRPRPDLLGRGARRRGVPRAPEPAGPRGVRSSAGGRAPPAAAAAPVPTPSARPVPPSSGPLSPSAPPGSAAVEEQGVRAPCSMSSSGGELLLAVAAAAARRARRPCRWDRSPPCTGRRGPRPSGCAGSARRPRGRPARRRRRPPGRTRV